MTQEQTANGGGAEPIPTESAARSDHDGSDPERPQAVLTRPQPGETKEQFTRRVAAALLPKDMGS